MKVFYDKKRAKIKNQKFFFDGNRFGRKIAQFYFC